MRPAKFFLGLLFAAAVLITLLKILMFLVMGALFVGSIYMITRMIGWAAVRRYQHRQSAQGIVPGNWNMKAESVFGLPTATAEPLVPRFRGSYELSPFTRTIEVR